MSFRINISVINLRGKTLLYYIVFNNSFTEDVLRFFLNEITLYINIKDLVRKTSTDYAFKKIKKTREKRTLDLKR
jgi:hypothetical protein